MATGRKLALLPLTVLVLVCWMRIPEVQADPQVQELGRQNTNASKGNYTVSFVPLISVLANFFPRLLSRFNPNIAVQQARSGLGEMGQRVMEATCNEVYPYQLRWPDPRNRQHFFYCSVDPACLTLGKDEIRNPSQNNLKCVTLRTEACPSSKLFDFNKQQCV